MFLARTGPTSARGPSRPEDLGKARSAERGGATHEREDLASLENMYKIGRETPGARRGRSKVQNYYILTSRELFRHQEKVPEAGGL